MANIGRISTLALHNRTMSNFSRVQEHLAGLQNQISSGIKANSFEGLTGEVEQFVGLEAKVRKLDNYIKNNTEISSRINTTDKALDNMTEIGISIKTLMTSRNDAVKDNIAFVQQLKSLRASFTNQLNQNLNGKYLFGGTRTDTPPIVEPIPPLAVEGEPDAGYYQGSTEDIYIRPQDNYSFAYNVRADESGFQKVFAAISMGIDGHEEDNDELLKKAFDTLSDGLEEINLVQTRVRANIVDINEITERHTASVLYYKGVTEDIAKTDTVSASIAVTIDQTILTATFQTFAKISNLNLSDFL